MSAPDTTTDDEITQDDMAHAAREILAADADADAAISKGVRGWLYEAAFASSSPAQRYDLELHDLGRAIEALCPRSASIRHQMLGLALSQIGDLYDEIDGHPGPEDPVLDLARAVGVYFLRVEAYWRAVDAKDAKDAKGGDR